MKNILYGIVVSAALFLTGCADAGSDQEANIGQTITLDANKSTPSAGGTITSYKWEQTQGPDVILQDQNTSKATFTAPNVTKRTNLAFRLTTTETGGRVSPYHSKDYVVVYVNPNGTEHNDTIPPVITLNGGSSIAIKLDSNYTELGAIATDNVDGNITNEINITSDVNTSLIGTYTVHYNVSDAAGNAADEVIRTVNVSNDDINDTEKPVITLNGESSVTINLDSNYTELGAIATDNVDGNITNEINITSDVTYTVHYNVSDAAGNAADEVIRTVTVDNNASGEIKVVSIADGEELEYGYIEHKVKLSAIPTTPILIPYSFENITTSDYDPNPQFDIMNEAIVELAKNNHIRIQGIQEFSIYIKTNNVNPNKEKEVQYKINLGGKTAKGTIIRIGR